VGAAAVAAFIISCATVERVVVAPPMIPGAKYVGMDECSACHEKIVTSFKRTQHAKLQIDGEKVKGQGCESCHGPGSLHVEAGGGKGKFIVNPGRKPEACMQCHLDKKVQFGLKSHHPVLEGKIACTDCHSSHGEDVKKPSGLLATRRVNDICAQCHRDQARPKVYEHMALREGCTTCHNAHGSINEKMLTERNANLCLKCHSFSRPGSGEIWIGEGHNTDAYQGACWSCHNMIHGSNIDSAFRY
jgi:predicted CXXCH cytochrome family protein